MADRDVEVDITARDKTGPATKSAAKNLKNVEKSWKDVDGQGKKTAAAAQHVAGQIGRGLSRVAGSAKRWADSGDTAGKRFVRGIGKGIGQLAELGGTIGGSLSKAVSAAGPYVQVAMVGILVAAAVAAAPAIAGAIVGGAGLGGVVGGLLLASKDVRVATAFKGLQDEVGSGLQDSAKRFVPATLDAVKRAKAAFKGMLPDLRRIFDVSATWLGPLTTSLGRAAQLALDGITKAVTKAGPIISVVGQGVEMIGRAVGQVFADLSDNGNSMALALKLTFALVAGAITQAGAALNFLVETFEWFVTKIPGGKQLLDGMSKSQDGAKTSAFNLAGGFQQTATDANLAADGISRVKEKADELADSNISLREAQIRSKDAIKDATKTLEENGKVHGFNSAKGRENESALNALATAFNAETTAGEKSGISAGKASEAYANNRAKLIAMAEKAGYSTTQAELLAAQLLKIPKNVNTDINIDTKTPQANVATIKKAIGTIKGKTVYVTVQERYNSDGSIHVSGKGGSGTLTRRWGGIDYAMAAGGMIGAHFAKSPTVLFGERATGGEAFIPRRGDLSRSRSIAQTVVRDWLGGDVAWPGQASAAAPAITVAPEVRVFIGERELTDIVDVRISHRDRGLRRRVGAGAGR